jgi:hypothetical protein
VRVRIVFGAGSVAGLTEEAERLGCRRPLVLDTAWQEAQDKRMLDLLGPCGAGLFAGARMHTLIDVTDGYDRGDGLVFARRSRYVPTWRRSSSPPPRLGRKLRRCL